MQEPVSAASTHIAADTSVLSRLSKTSEDSEAYEAMIGSRRLAMSFQSTPELSNAGFVERRQQRLKDLLTAVVELPHSAATNEWYARTTARRSELQKKQFSGAFASDADVWIISSALEHGLPLLSHDKEQVDLGRAMGLKVLTNLPTLRDSNPALN